MNTWRVFSKVRSEFLNIIKQASGLRGLNLDTWKASVSQVPEYEVDMLIVNNISQQEVEGMAP
jgi:hypothetical protein